MESEKVKEIKIVLKGLVDDASNWLQKAMIGGVNLADILTLINELESENERLLEQRNKTYNIWVKDTEKLKARIAELEKENKWLTLERDVLVGKKIAERPKTKESIIAPIYVLPNVQSPELMLKLGEKNLVQQFAERLKEKFDEQKHFYVTASISHRDISLTALNTAYRCLDQTLKEFIE